MKKGLLIGGLSVGLMLLLLAVAACGQDLQPRVNELESQVSSLGAEKGQLESQVSSLGTEKTNLQGQVQTLQAEKTDAESKLKGLEGEKATLESQVSSLDARRADLELAKAATKWDTADLENANLDLEKLNQALKDIAGPLPDSLDNLYPPNAPAPLLMLQMFAMVQPLEGAFVDMMQGDTENVMANWEAFKTEYQKTSQMVPEWSDRFPMEPLEAVEAALPTGDPGQVMGAMGGLFQVCGSCHVVNQQKVRAKYHWPDFGEVMLTNTLTGVEKPWVEFMGDVALAYTGIGNDLQQGQMDNALQNFQGFSALFTTLREQGCIQCHETERYYFVDQTVLDDIEALGNELQSAAPNPEAIGGLLQKIGGESCGKCHLVHQPAEQLKRVWLMFDDLFE